MTVRRALSCAVVLMLVVAAAALASGWPAAAQEDRPPAQPGDPPIAERITLSEPDENGLVTIQGDVGAVFPGAVVAIRNMYTGETVYPRAELTGAFFGQIYGPGNTPFWISPARNVEAFERGTPGSLPGGPGFIVAGRRPASFASLVLPEPVVPEGAALTALVIDGDTADWDGLALTPQQVAVQEGLDALVYAVANQESLYVGLVPADPERGLPADYAYLDLGLKLNGQRFSVRIDPRRGGGGRLYSGSAGGGLVDLGPVGGISAQQTGGDGSVELRLPRTVTGVPASLELVSVRFLGDDYCTRLMPDYWADNTFITVQERAEVDSRRAQPWPGMPAGAVPFTLSGPVGGGTGTWHAVGRINQTSFAAGEMLLVEMQVTMNAPAMVGEGLDMRLGAELRLEPVTIGGAQMVADRATGNGWSGLLTPSGLPVENVMGSLPLGDATAQRVVVEDGQIFFLLRWAMPLQETIPAGLYTPALTGYVAVPGLYGSWADSEILGSGAGAGVPMQRLPFVLRIGDAADTNRLVWSMFQEHAAASGARGLLPQEDAGVVAVSGRTAHSGGVYILPRVDPTSGEPIAYPLEPYLPAMLGNSAWRSIQPLIPFTFESGELQVAVTGPDGQVDDLGTFPLVQNRLSSPERIEPEAFGADSPLDVYRLTTLDPRLTAYTFARDGRYEISLQGTIHDIWGNTYTGGGTYEVWLAEPLQMLPGVLPGTPFEVGNVFNPALTVVPGFSAEVTTQLQVFPLDGGQPTTYTISGTANAHGLFQRDRDAGFWTFNTPGEYLVDTVASYTDSLGRLWMGSLRGAGVIASPEGTLIARGGRWLANAPAEDRMAWYALGQTAREILEQNAEARLRWPYNSGDVLWVPDGIGRLAAGLRLTDREGAYEDWLQAHLAGWRDSDGMTVQALANEDELPLVMTGLSTCDHAPALASEDTANQAYAYLSAVRPGVSIRQMVLGDDVPDWVQPGWALNDPYNNQRGVGRNGDLPGDYAFLFGGAVVHNAELDLHEAAIYGSFMMVVDRADPAAGRVFPPFRGAANGPDGGPLLTVRDAELEMLFISTAFQPGQIFTVGDTLTLGGQIAPALPALVHANVVTPSGRILPVNGRANTVGYYYSPDQSLTLDEPGIWRIRLAVTYDGWTSAGAVQEPYPVGSVPGAEDGEIYVYVLPEDAPAVRLDNPRVSDAFMPTALQFNLTAAVPAEWKDVRMHYTALMNGIVLDSGTQPALGGIFAYSYDPRRLNAVFPNLDTTLANTQTPYSADAVRITLVLEGLDADGDLVMAGRTLALFGGRLLTLYDGWPQPEEAGQ